MKIFVLLLTVLSLFGMILFSRRNSDIQYDDINVPTYSDSGPDLLYMPLTTEPPEAPYPPCFPENENIYIPEPPMIDDSQEEMIIEPVSTQPRFNLPPGPLIALTFDDGPSSLTLKILDILEYHNVRATFCVLGNRVVDQSRAPTILRAVNGGNEIVGHSWNHRNFVHMTNEAIEADLRNTSDAIEALIGYRPTLFRPPFGVTDYRVEMLLEELGYAILHWNLDPRDWENRDANHIYEHVMHRASHGDIILLHDIFEPTVEAVKRLIPSLLESGFSFVTASEMLWYLYGDIAPGWIYKGGEYEPIRTDPLPMEYEQ